LKQSSEKAEDTTSRGRAIDLARTEPTFGTEFGSSVPFSAVVFAFSGEARRPISGRTGLTSTEAAVSWGVGR
jgi:hypothetical protein